MADATDNKNHSRRRTVAEALGWIGLVGFLWTVDTLSKLSIRAQTGVGKDNFRLINDQVTSALAVLIMIVFVVYWLRLFPLRRDRWFSSLLGHIAGSVIFAFGHHTLAVVMRVIVYWFRDMEYMWRVGYVQNLIVEYQKDIKIYLAAILIVSGYQFYRRSSAEKEEAPPPADRLLVQTGSGEAVIRHEQIDYLEASRNYVAIHTAEKEYLIRDTISAMSDKLPAAAFVRCHRSYIVNLDKVEEIKNVDGSWQIQLAGGAVVPLSRSYRDAFRKNM